MRKTFAVCFFALPLAALFLFMACKHPLPPQPGPDGTFPPEVAKIMVTRCATAGCHNYNSYSGAAGLLTANWTSLFKGGNNGAVVVPYAPENSSLLYYINTDPALGPVATPTMPEGGTPLSAEEYNTIVRWIAAGAPDKNGMVPFAASPDTRQKIYLTQQGCDLVAVIDAGQQVVMRYIPVGKDPAIESPHCVRFSDDGRYAYVSFLAGEYIQKIDVAADKVIADVHVGSGSWNIFKLSPDGKQMLLSDWQGNGKLLLINTDQMQITQQFSGPNLFVYPHGIAANPAFDTFFVTAQYGNLVYKISVNDGFYKKISIDGAPFSTANGKRDPHEIMMTPDHSRYFLTCEASNEVRVMDAYADTLIRAIPVGIFPQELAVSYSTPYMFVTCMEDNSSVNGYKGSVYAINYNTYESIRIDGKFYQPHGITVDDRNGLIYIASRNANPNGPAPHHASSCSGRNGWYNIYDLHTLQPYNTKRYEVSVEPYSADTRFKE